MSGALTSREVFKTAVRALQVASQQSSPDAAVSAARGLLLALDGDDARRVAACLAVIVTQQPPAGPADVLGWIDRLERRRRVGEDIAMLNALWSAGEAS